MARIIAEISLTKCYFPLMGTDGHGFLHGAAPVLAIRGGNKQQAARLGRTKVLFCATDAPLASAAQPTTRGRSDSQRSVPIWVHQWAIYIWGASDAGGESARTCARFCARFLGLTAMVLSEIGVHLCTVGVACIFLMYSRALSLTEGFVFPTDGLG